MTAPVVASPATTGSSNSASYTVAVPTSTANGDLLIGVVASDFGTSAGNSFPAGWTALTTSTYDGGTDAFHVKLYARVAASEPASYTISHDNSDSVAAILRITGWDSASGIAGAIKQVAPSTTGTGTTAPSLTPFGADDLLITFHGAESSAGGSRTWTPPTGMTEQADRQSTTWASLEVNSLANPSTPSGTKVATPSASVDTGAACTISIKALGGGSGGTATPAATSTTVAAPHATPVVSDAGTPAATSTVVALPQAVPSVSDAGTPAATPAVVSLPQATPRGNATVIPAAIAVVAALPHAAVSVATGPVTLTATAAVPQASPQTAGNATAAPAPVSAVVGVPAASRSGAATASPASLAAVAALPAASPIAGGNVTATPAPVGVVAGLPAAVPKAAATVAPDVIVSTVAVPRPAVGTAVGPASIVVLARLAAAAPVAASSVTRTPGPIVTVVAVPHVSAFAEGGVRGRMGELSARLPGGVVAPETFESGGTIR